MNNNAMEKIETVSIDELRSVQLERMKKTLHRIKPVRCFALYHFVEASPSGRIVPPPRTMSPS